MFLKSLTLRGFKSFADRTDLAFEPGITVVVGPNGSGKSNVVDALTWVLGTGSAKALRGTAMSDVIFAGSGGGRRQGRSALGRASVEITIDNAAGTLPIDFSEVTVGRAMFANGENTYTINGEECRLLDVQELLSDTGLGRENHTIVGQGQLDTVLNARPEDRRAFIEEAAGILKHRRRKERALRKLAQTEQHLERLTDLLRELRRQLRPLERQAEAAARHAELTASLQRVRVALAVRELAALTARLAGEDEGGGASAAQLAEVEARLGEARDRHDALERELSRQAPAARAAAEVHFRLANLTERSRGLVDRIAERTRGLAEAVEEPVAGRDPAELRARAAEAHAQRDGAEAERRAASAAVADAGGHRQEAERARRAHEQAAAAEARRRAQARERRLRWEGSRATLASGLAQSAGEQGRLASQVEGWPTGSRSWSATRWPRPPPRRTTRAPRGGWAPTPTPRGRPPTAAGPRWPRRRPPSARPTARSPGSRPAPRPCARRRSPPAPARAPSRARASRACSAPWPGRSRSTRPWPPPCPPPWAPSATPW